MAENDNALSTFLGLLLVVFIFFLGAWIFTIFYNALAGPNNPMTPILQVIYTSIFGLFDKSFVFLLFLFLILDIFKAYRQPKLEFGIGNLILIFSFVFIFLNVKGAFMQFFTELNMSQYLPVTYAALSNNYLAILIFFMLILATIMHFRKPETTQSDLTQADFEYD